MTMDALELLGTLGQVEPADQAVLEAALGRFAEATARDADDVRPERRARRRRRSGLATAVAAAMALAAAASFVVFGHSGTMPERGDSPAANGGKAPVASVRTPSNPQSRSTVSAVLAAFIGSSKDVLRVSKTVRGEGTCCKSTIWISPTEQLPGATVRSRILNRSLAGSLLDDMTLTYVEPKSAPATAGADCSDIFGRPKIASAAEPGFPGTVTLVNYLSRVWATGNVQVQAPTLPSGAALRACLNDGQWRVTGQSLHPRSKMIELVSSNSYQRLWVSAATFLPDRLVSITKTPTGPITISFAFRFLPPSAASEASLTRPAIPAGFSKISIPG
jgi:hypothetical protein